MTTLKLTPFFAVPRANPLAAFDNAERTHPGWIERLAAWADRQPPQHHHLGRWTMVWSPGRFTTAASSLPSAQAH